MNNEYSFFDIMRLHNCSLNGSQQRAMTSDERMRLMSGQQNINSSSTGYPEDSFRARYLEQLDRMQQYQCGTDPLPEQESDQDWRIWLVPTLEEIEEENLKTNKEV